VRRKAATLPAANSIGVADLARWLTFYCLWLACLQVVVEGYDRSHQSPETLLSDPVIDRVLTAERRAVLRRFRNTILHPEFYDHPDAAAVLRKYRDVARWAVQLTKEFERLLRDKLKTE
jgi:hypothetical protein